MKIETFALERWMTTYEVNVDYDIAESGILSDDGERACSILMPEDERERTLARPA